MEYLCKNVDDFYHRPGIENRIHKTTFPRHFTVQCKNGKNSGFFFVQFNLIQLESIEDLFNYQKRETIFLKYHYYTVI